MTWLGWWLRLLTRWLNPNNGQPTRTGGYPSPPQPLDMLPKVPAGPAPGAYARTIIHWPEEET